MAGIRTSLNKTAA